MKKFLVALSVALMSSASLFAQSDAAQLAKEQAELNKIHLKMLNAKPTKDAKKQTKVLAKQGWMAPAGEKGIEKQLTESQFMGEELMLDELGGRTKRFIQHTAFATGGTYNVAYAAARSNALIELAAQIKTQIAAAMQGKLDNAQSSAISTISVDKFNQRAKAIVDETLTNNIPVVGIYRVLQNNNFEVQVRLAFDKKELSARLKRKMQQELEAEGDELNEIVDEVLKGNF